MVLIRYRLWLYEWPPTRKRALHFGIIQFEPPFVVVALAHGEIEWCRSARDRHELFGGIQDGKLTDFGSTSLQPYVTLVLDKEYKSALIL